MSTVAAEGGGQVAEAVCLQGELGEVGRGGQVGHDGVL